MTGLIGGGDVSFSQLHDVLPEDTTVTYEGRIRVPAGAVIDDVYWYTRVSWEQPAVLDVVATVGILQASTINTNLFVAEDITLVDTGDSFRAAGGEAAAGELAVSAGKQDFVFTVVETVASGQARVGVTIAGVIWTTPGVTVVGAPTIVLP